MRTAIRWVWTAAVVITFGYVLATSPTSQVQFKPNLAMAAGTATATSTPTPIPTCSAVAWYNVFGHGKGTLSVPVGLPSPGSGPQMLVTTLRVSDNCGDPDPLIYTAAPTGLAPTPTPTATATATPTATPTPIIAGGGTLAAGSGLWGRITGLAATSNVLTLPGLGCANAMTCVFQDNTTAGGVKITGQTTQSETFSATASDAADYGECGCR